MPHEYALAPKCQLLNHELTFNNPSEAVTNICEPEQWLLNEDCKSLEVNNWRCLGKLLASVTPHRQENAS